MFVKFSVYFCYGDKKTILVTLLFKAMFTMWNVEDFGFKVHSDRFMLYKWLLEVTSKLNSRFIIIIIVVSFYSESRIIV